MQKLDLVALKGALIFLWHIRFDINFAGTKEIFLPDTKEFFLPLDLIERTPFVGTAKHSLTGRTA